MALDWLSPYYCPPDRRLLALLADHTDELVEGLRGLDRDDLTGPSHCEGWTRDHVATHLACNAAALRRLIDSAVDGSTAPMYASEDQRDAEVEAGLGRTADELADAIATTADALASSFRRLTPEAADVMLERFPGGTMVAAGAAPFRRLREVVYHHHDLDLGRDLSQLDDELASAFLEEETSRLTSRADVSPFTLVADDETRWEVGVHGPEIYGRPGDLLAWLARGDESGVDAPEGLPARTFGG